MGQMNFLQGGYTGTLGQTYGVKQRRTVYAKARPFSHTPHNKAQRDSFSAFSVLQRFCAGVNKNFWQYSGLSDRKRNRQNVTAEFFKAMVSNHQFDFRKVYDVVPDTGMYTAYQFDFIPRNEWFEIYTTFTAEIWEYQHPLVFLGVFDPEGRLLGAEVTDPLNGNHTLPTLFTNKTNAYLVILVSGIKNGERGLVSSYYKALKADSDIVVREEWFPNRMANGDWTYESPETLKGVGVNCRYEDETLYF